MGVRIIRDEEQNYGVLYCSVAMIPFGGIFYLDTEDPEEFLTWLDETYHEDARIYSEKELQNKIYEWRKHLEVINQ